MSAVKDMQLAPMPQDTKDITAQIVELAANPAFDVAKLQALVQMQERAQARVSSELFNAAMTDAQTAMRPVSADAENPSTRSAYATYGALDKALRPVYTGNGFGLSFNTGDSPLPDHVRVLCLVTHRDGHSREYHIDMPADGKGAKGNDVMTKTHAVGSAVSYGMRYLLKMIFNVAIGEDDDDGNAAGRTAPVAQMPEGFQAWWDDLKATADEGLEALKAAWEQSPKPFKAYVAKVNSAAWEKLKQHAAKTGGVQ